MTTALTANGTVESGSLLDRIKAKRERRIVTEHLDLPVPGWDGDLVGRFKVLDEDEYGDIVDRNLEEDSKRGHDLDLLARANVAILGRDGESYVKLERDGVPVTFGVGLKELLGIDAENTRGVVEYVFNSNGIALRSYAMKVFSWMTDTSQEVDGQVAGES